MSIEKEEQIKKGEYKQELKRLQIELVSKCYISPTI